MRYTDFDAEFPRRCIQLLGKAGLEVSEHGCTKLLAVGGTLVSATGDRQFAWGERVHVATGAQADGVSRVQEFLSADADEALPALRDRLSSQYSGSAQPSYWNWAPMYFEIRGVRPGQPDLRDLLLEECKQPPDRRPASEPWSIKYLLRTFRNGLAHGNAWLLAGVDFEESDPRHAAKSAIAGFAFATTNPALPDPMSEADRKLLCKKCSKRPKLSADTLFKVEGVVISPFALRALIEGWATLLAKCDVSRSDGGSQLQGGDAD
jgi:hypothetical protein